MELLMQNKGSIKNLESGFQPIAVNRPDIGHQDEGHQGARHQAIKEPDIGNLVFPSSEASIGPNKCTENLSRLTW